MEINKLQSNLKNVILKLFILFFLTYSDIIEI